MSTCMVMIVVVVDQVDDPALALIVPLDISFILTVTFSLFFLNFFGLLNSAYSILLSSVFIFKFTRKSSTKNELF